MVAGVAVLALVGGVVVSVGPLRTSALLVDIEFARATENLGAEGSAATAAVVATPCWTRARRALAQVQGNTGDLSGSATTLMEALDCDPRDTAAMEMLAVLADADGRQDEAAGWYERFTELSPYVRGQNRTVARWALEAGEPELALEAVDRLEAVTVPGSRGHDGDVALIAEVRAAFEG